MTWIASDTQGCLQAALRYASSGFPVLPLHWPIPKGMENGVKTWRCSCGRHTCKRIGKHPSKQVANGLKDATTDPKMIRGWWQNEPKANVAIVLGACPHGAGMFAVDVDPRNGGDETLARIEGEYGDLGDTLRACTGGGGEHVFFSHPGWFVANGTHRLGLGVDIKGDGGYVVAPPSLHESGQRYAWKSMLKVIPQAPPWLLERLKAYATGTDSKGPALRRTSSAHVVKRAIAYLAAMPEAVSGKAGHDVTFNAACAVAQGFALELNIAQRLLLEHYNTRCTPPWTETELTDKVTSAVQTSTRPLGYLLAPISNDPLPDVPASPMRTDGSGFDSFAAQRILWGRDSLPLTTTQRAVATCLLTATSGIGHPDAGVAAGECILGISKITGGTGLSKTAVVTSLKALEDGGWIECTARPRAGRVGWPLKSNLYRLTFERGLAKLREPDIGRAPPEVPWESARTGVREAVTEAGSDGPADQP